MEENEKKPMPPHCLLLPPQKDHGHICDVCFWENDNFIENADDPSLCNHGLTLNQGRENYPK